MNPGLYIVGTPIGNLSDISPRALDTLRGVEAILAEDTRCTQVLLSRYEIKTPLISCHKFNEASRLDSILGRLRAGAALALVTDSGMPGVSDPGARVVEACHKAGLPVVVIPGPSAVTSAVALSGVRGAGFVFAGFLPRTPGARRTRLSTLATLEMPVVIFESPYRLVRLLGEIGEIYGARRVTVTREMTKKFEECVSGTAADLIGHFGDRPVKGEIVVVIAAD